MGLVLSHSCLTGFRGLGGGWPMPSVEPVDPMLGQPRNRRHATVLAIRAISPLSHALLGPGGVVLAVGLVGGVPGGPG
jgi:hypothetical protein